ncbi:uncharacterized protein [Maniola hyperantus]
MDYRRGKKSRLYLNAKRKIRRFPKKRQIYLAPCTVPSKDKSLCLKCPRDGCDTHFLDQTSLDLHLNHVHEERVPSICDWENCGKSFKSAQAAKAHKKRIHYDRAPHKCTKCEKGFNKFEDIKSHFLLTHTKWKKDDSSADNKQTNIPIDKESTSGANDLTSLSFTPDVSENEDSSDGFESFFDKPKLKTQKVEIVFECNWEDCGKCFKTSGELESHKKTHDVDDNDDKLQKCTKCDARFESFELVKTHFLHTHTNWKKEEALDEDKESKDVTIVKESSDCENVVPQVSKIEDQRAAVKKTNKNGSKNILNRNKTSKVFNAVTSDSKVEDFASNSNDTTLYENQSVSNTNNTVDDPKNTYLIITEEVMLNSENPTFYIVKTKPKAENSTSDPQDNKLFQLLTQNAASNFTNNITVANSPSSFTQHDMSKAKVAMSYARNLISDLRKNASNVENNMPQIGNTTSIQANVIPIVRNITPNHANVIPIVRNITPNHANVIPIVRNITPSLANVIPVVSNVTPNHANVIPVVGNNTPNVANVRPVAGNMIPYDENKIPGVRKYVNTKLVGKNGAITKPWANKSASMLANIIPVIGNIVPKVPVANIPPDFANTTRDFGTSTSDLKNSRRRLNRQSSNYLDETKRRVDGSKIQKCDDSGDSSTKASHLDGNVRKPTGHVPYICPSDCGKRFGRRDELDRHMHLRLRNKAIFFHCHICRKRFITSDFLQKHLKTHEKDLLGTQANSDNDDVEIIEEVDAGGYLSSESTDVTNAACPESDTAETTDEDNSEVEDNTNPTTESSDEDDSSEEENITNDNTKVPGLVENEVCLDLGENFDNTPVDPFSGITSFEGVPLPQIIKREEETTEPMPRLIGIGEKNIEFVPEQLINTEDFDELILPQIVGIREDTIELLPSAIVKEQDEYIEIKHIPEEGMNTEECVESKTDQILNTVGESMELMPLERIKREDENIEPIPESEQMVNTEEGIDLNPAKRIKREKDINVADATLALALQNRILQVRLERLPFFI